MKILALSVLTVALLGATAAPHPKNITIVVNGQSVISRAPDVATVSLNLMTTDDVAARATSENNSRYNDLLNHLRSLGIPDDSIRTVGFNINYVPASPGNQPPQRGYTVTRQVQVRLTNLELIGSVIDQAVGTSVTNIDGISYTLSKQRQIYAQALGAAVADAQMQARAMAAAANMKILGISAMQGGYAAPIAEVARVPSAQAYSTVSPPTQVPPSKIDVQASVTVTYVVGP